MIRGSQFCWLKFMKMWDRLQRRRRASFVLLGVRVLGIEMGRVVSDWCPEMMSRLYVCVWTMCSNKWTWVLYSQVYCAWSVHVCWTMLVWSVSQVYTCLDCLFIVYFSFILKYQVIWCWFLHNVSGYIVFIVLFCVGALSFYSNDGLSEDDQEKVVFMKCKCVIQ
jgi:hypothetical protein